jgi:hypothetical protein
MEIDGERWMFIVGSVMAYEGMFGVGVDIEPSDTRRAQNFGVREDHIFVGMYRHIYDPVVASYSCLCLKEACPSSLE